MKPTIAGVVCHKCRGKGIKVKYERLLGQKPYKHEVICGYCNGEGVIRFQGDRTGIEWEGE